jgi:sulfoxide reductase heme-binding subunit YedZ
MNVSTWPLPARLMMAAAAGVLAATMLPGLLAPLTASDLPLMWWASRASGIVAYLALALSMAFGLMVTSRAGGFGRATYMELHQQWALAAVIAVVVHVVTIVGHAASGVAVAAAVVPFASARLTGPVALGTLALWGVALLAVTSWWRKAIPYGAWRAIHAAAFGTFLLGIVHGITVGTDTAQVWMVALYAATAGLIVGTAIYRFLVRPN